MDGGYFQIPLFAPRRGTKGATIIEQDTTINLFTCRLRQRLISNTEQAFHPWNNLGAKGSSVCLFVPSAAGLVSHHWLSVKFTELRVKMLLLYMERSKLRWFRHLIRIPHCEGFPGTSHWETPKHAQNGVIYLFWFVNNLGSLKTIICSVLITACLSSATSARCLWL